jgi:hypothetical protein
MLVAQPFISDRLPQAVGGKRESVTGVVTAKGTEGNQLLLTIVTPEGATLATFTKRVGEITLLVETGDRLTLTLGGYQPFLQDPPITRVRKPPFDSEIEPAAPDSATAAEPASPADSLANMGADTLPPGESRINEPAGRWYD